MNEAVRTNLLLRPMVRCVYSGSYNSMQSILDTVMSPIIPLPRRRTLLLLVVADLLHVASNNAAAAGLTTTTTASEAAAAPSCNSRQYADHPALCEMIDWAATSHDDDGKNSFVAHAHAWAAHHGALVDLRDEARDVMSDNYDESILAMSTTPLLSFGTMDAYDATGQLPVVLAHGMGDSCYNAGLQHITQHVSDLLGGVYTVCIPIGASQADDTKNGYFLNMNDSVQVLQQAIGADANLRHGFHGIGFSQGSNVLRGYITWTDQTAGPALHTYISVNGVNAGVGAVPYCRPDYIDAVPPGHASTTTTAGFSLCDLLMEQASARAYTEFAQQHSFQANYWRDPRPGTPFAKYQQYAQLAVWNNEVATINATLQHNWARTSQFVWIMASADNMVFPREGEHWGAPDPRDPFHTILPMNETDWYVRDLFGLRTADEAGKNVFETFEGDHLQFSMDDFDRWVTSYLQNSNGAATTEAMA